MRAQGVSRAELNRWLTEKHRAELREAMAAYDAAIAELRALRGRDLASQRETCAARVKATGERAGELYRAAVELARTERDRMKGQARAACAYERAEIRGSAREEIDRQKEGKKTRRARYRGEVRREKSTAALERKRTKASARVSAAEENDAVRSALEVEAPELLPAWDRWGRRMKATARATKREVFLEWAQENPAEVLHARELAGARGSRQLAREQREAFLAEVPF